MSEFSELIKRFDKVRSYMHDFYLYGFHSREDFAQKSLRSYDNERRRIESYLGDYMAFRQDEGGKAVFLSVDSGDIPANPLYRAFKASSFTRNDITLHFLLLDMLRDGAELSAEEVADGLSHYLAAFESPLEQDLSTVRGKLREYAKLGLLASRTEGKRLLFSLATDGVVLDEGLADAITFFSEICPLGVVGSYIMDQRQLQNRYFSYKHHYIMPALDSEIVLELLDAIEHKQMVHITMHNLPPEKPTTCLVTPICLLTSVQDGRQYLAGYDHSFRAAQCWRLDYITEVRSNGLSYLFATHQAIVEERLLTTWGASVARGSRMETLEMVLEVLPHEAYIVDRLRREGRFGTVTQLDDTHWQYSIAVGDPTELQPWLRTFIGRIVSLKCSVEAVARQFYIDLDMLYSQYEQVEVTTNAVP